MGDNKDAKELSYEQELIERIKMKREMLLQLGAEEVESEQRECVVAAEPVIRSQTELNAQINSVISQLREIEQETRRHRHVSARKRRRMTLAELKELDDYEVEAHKIILQRHQCPPRKPDDTAAHELIEFAEEVSEREYSYSSSSSGSDGSVRELEATEAPGTTTTQEESGFEIIDLTKTVPEPSKKIKDDSSCFEFSELAPIRLETAPKQSHEDVSSDESNPSVKEIVADELIVQVTEEADRGQSPDDSELDQRSMDLQFDVLSAAPKAVEEFEKSDPEDSAVLQSSMIEKCVASHTGQSPIHKASEQSLQDIRIATRDMRKEEVRKNYEEECDVKKIRKNAVRVAEDRYGSSGVSEASDSMTLNLNTVPIVEHPPTQSESERAVRSVSSTENKSAGHRRGYEAQEIREIRNIRIESIKEDEDTPSNVELSMVSDDVPSYNEEIYRAELLHMASQFHSKAHNPPPNYVPSEKEGVANMRVKKHLRPKYLEVAEIEKNTSTSEELSPDVIDEIPPQQVYNTQKNCEAAVTSAPGELIIDCAVQLDTPVERKEAAGEREQLVRQRIAQKRNLMPEKTVDREGPQTATVHVSAEPAHAQDVLRKKNERLLQKGLGMPPPRSDEADVADHRGGTTG